MTLDTATLLGLALKDDEIARCQAMPYRDYLKTHWWNFIHDRTIKRSNGECELCQDAAATEAHHTTYDRIGCEHPDDLIALCRRCHQHITDNGLDKLTRGDLLRKRRQIMHSPEFSRGWGRF